MTNTGGGGNPKMQAEVVVDGSQAVSGFNEVEQAAKRTAEALNKEGSKGAAGVDKIGAGAQKSAGELERAEKRILSSIRRVSLEAEFGKSTPDFFAAQARALGLQSEAVAQGIDGIRQAQLRKAAADQQSAAALLAQQQAMRTARADANNLTQAYRQLPAQITDITTSLATGMPVWMVAIQQGGQLKDSFGGIGPALKATATGFIDLISPMSLALTALGAVGFGLISGSRQSTEFASAVALSGKAAGVTASQLSDLARASAAATGGTQTRAGEVLRALAQAGVVGEQNLRRFTEAAIELERVGGPAAEETAKAFADLAKSPLDGALRLNEATNFLTAGLVEQIKALSDVGRGTEAAKLAQDAYFDAVMSRKDEVAGAIGLVDQAWRGVKDTVGAVLDTIRDIGRESSSKRLAELESQLGGAQRLQGSDGGGLLGAFFRQREQAIRQEIEALRETERLGRRAADAAAEQARLAKERARFLKEGDAFLSTDEKRAQELQRLAQDYVKGAASFAEVQERAERIRQRYEQRAGAGAGRSDAERELEAQARLLNEISGYAPDYERNIGRIIEAGQRQGTAQEQVNAQLVAYIEQQPFYRRAQKEQEDGAKAIARAEQEATKAREQYLSETARATAGYSREAQQLDDQIVLLTQGKQALEERILLRMEEQALAIEGSARMFDADDATVAALWAQADALREVIKRRKELNGVTTDKEAAEAARKSADAAEREWTRAVEQVGQSLSDALLEGGMSAGELIKGYFRSLVLKPVIQAIVNPVAGAALGSLGLAGAANAATGASGIGSLLNLGGLVGGASSLFSAGTAATLAGNFGGAMTAAGNLIGSGSIGTGLGFGAGAIAPYALAAAAIYSIAKSFDKSGTPHTGSVVNVAAIGDTLRSRTVYGDSSRILDNYNPQTDTALRVLTQAAVGALNGVDRAFGGAGGLSAVSKFAADNTDASIGSFDLTRANGQLLAQVGTPNQYAFFDRDAGTGLQQFSKQVAVQTIGALNQMNLPEWARKISNEVIANLPEQATAEEALTALGQVTEAIAAMQSGMVSLQRVVEPLGGTFSRVARLSGDALSQLIEFAGGLDSFESQVRGFAQNYLERDEIAGLRSREVLDALQTAGFTPEQLAGLDTRAEFRGLVDGVDPTTEAGRRQLATLLGVQGSFAELADYFGESGFDLRSSAALAPNSGVFGEPGALIAPQVQATNEVRDSVDALGPLLERIADLIGTGGRVTRPGKLWPEVQYAEP